MSRWRIAWDAFVLLVLVLIFGGIMELHHTLADVIGAVLIVGIVVVWDRAQTRRKARTFGS